MSHSFSLMLSRSPRAVLRLASHACNMTGSHWSRMEGTLAMFDPNKSSLALAKSKEKDKRPVRLVAVGSQTARILSERLWKKVDFEVKIPTFSSSTSNAAIAMALCSATDVVISGPDASEEALMHIRSLQYAAVMRARMLDRMKYDRHVIERVISAAHWLKTEKKTSRVARLIFINNNNHTVGSGVGPIRPAHTGFMLGREHCIACKTPHVCDMYKSQDFLACTMSWTDLVENLIRRAEYFGTVHVNNP